ncbi:efflux RND transporter permease subunit [Mycetocola spongiae]|uniref:efflux RND transporter permease subunit n=1 Tax=Mycetocola spongiae TaxID=2859226 RepID=UPI001CF2948D|nr:efflux RND transporter permease subunit [Mycetocola spongiae]UCR88468.1 efflux RND transporter permease subunit [Mycetocola spongiae]
MHQLAVLSMKNRALIALITVVAALFGGLAMTSLKQELAPSVQFPQLVILTSYPGAAPEVVNNDLSTPIETAIQGVPGLESTATTSNTNVSMVTAKFRYGTDLATAEQKITQAVNRIKSSLPDNSDPQVISGSFDDLPVIQISATGGGSADELANLLRRDAVPDLSDLEGVREAALVGAPQQRITITPNPEALAAQGLSLAIFADTLKQNGVLLPAGEITEGDHTFSVQAGSQLGSVEDIQALPVVATTPTDPAAPVVTLGSLATVVQGNDPTTSISRVDGKDAITIAVTKTPDANTVAVSQAVRDLLPQIEKNLGSGVSLTVVFDQAPFIEQSIEALSTEGLLGLVFAVLVILLFLMDVRATLVTAISIPTSVLITFIGLQVSGYTLNILTLGALTIAIGRVVDDSIVVIENIKRHLQAATDRSPAGRVISILTAVREVAGAITASTITTVAVFLPLAFVGDMTGELFRPFALTVTIALLASLLVALTIVPVLAYWFLRVKDKKPAEPAAVPAAPEPVVAAVAAEAPAPQIVSERYTRPLNTRPADPILTDTGALAVVGGTRRSRRAGGELPDELDTPTRMQRAYLPIIDWTLRHSAATLLIAVLVLGGTLALVPFMKTNFLGASGQNTLSISQTLEQGASLAAQDAAAKKVEETLRGIDGIETVQASIGSSGSALADAFSGGGSGQISYSITTDESADQEALQDTVRKRLDDLKDVGEITLASSSGFGASSDVIVRVQAPTSAELTEATTAIHRAMEKLDGVSQVEDSLAESRPYIQVKVDRDAAARAGYSEVALGGLVAQAMRPGQIGSVAINETNLNIYLASDNPPATLAEVREITVPTLTGPVRLDQLASVEQADGPASISTVKGQRSANVTVTPAGDDLSQVSAEVQQAITDTAVPAAANVTLGGVSADQATAFRQLGLAMLAAILIVYIVMVATFRSLRQPLLLLVSVPFAATGAIGLQVATGVPLGVPSLIGVLMLVGIVVTNAIVLVDLVNQYRARGMDVISAVRHGSARRLRPILMTALATIFALIPMALGITGHGGFISQPLAIVVIGGLISSTVLTLIVLPSLYNLVEGARERREAKRAAKAAA